MAKFSGNVYLRYLPVLTLLLLANLVCHPIRSQQKVTIYFPFNKPYITTEAGIILENAVKANSKKIIDSVKIYAWCDAIGAVSMNDTLAMQRATSVKKFLRMHKIGMNGFKDITGYGKRAPINDNSNDSLRALNRRAEVLIFARMPSFKDSVRMKMLSGKAGENVRLGNLNFYGGRHILMPPSKPLLDSLVSVLKTVPAMEIEIQGYVCCVPLGTEGYDQDTQQWKLSLNRARTVYQYLVAKGIAANRLSYKGLGNHPLVAELTDEDIAINRRVEIKIVKR